jgi:hypothetical protein
MKYRDVFIQILSEASGRPVDQGEDMLDSLLPFLGSKHRFDDEISDQDGERLLTELRAELPGIRRWLAEGALSARQRIQDAASRN